MKIKSLTARPILDSRGQWTIEATLRLKNGVTAVASVPQGKSTGSSEAVALPAAVAVRKIKSDIEPALKRADVRSQEALDSLLIKLDGTGNKSHLGANAILATSIAFLRATAMSDDVPLWKKIQAVYEGMGGSTTSPHKMPGVAAPRLFMNMVNGGLHAGNNLRFQEYLVIPKCRTIRESVEVGMQLYHALGAALARSKGSIAKNVGDEGGYAPDFANDVEPFRIMHALARTLKLSKKVDFGMDAAATDIKKAKHAELRDTYLKLVRSYGLIYLEDPFSEEDFLAFAALNMRLGAKTWITGDDLTVTNVRRITRARTENSVGGVIIKPNQIGTVSESLEAVKAARKYRWAIVASHRSGETDDDFIADFAYAVRADGVKLGAPARGERTAKYNRLLAIEAGK